MRPSSGLLRGISSFKTDISGLPINPIFVGQAVQEEEFSSTAEEVYDLANFRLPKINIYLNKRHLVSNNVIFIFAPHSRSLEQLDRKCSQWQHNNKCKVIRLILVTFSIKDSV
jgi:hypothetical protein